MKQTTDLGRDKIWLLVLKLAVPSMIAQFVTVLYSIIDRMFIGNIPSFSGPKARFTRSLLQTESPLLWRLLPFFSFSAGIWRSVCSSDTLEKLSLTFC